MTSIYWQSIDRSIGQPKVKGKLKVMKSADLLIDSLKKGEEDAFQEIWNRFYLPVQKFIYNTCQDYDLSEELTQETFFRAFKAIKTFESKTKFSSWIFGIARNVLLENLRNQKKHKDNVDIEDNKLSELSKDEKTPANFFLDKEIYEKVEIALLKIPQEQRMIFSLRVLQDKSYQEIADITGHSLSKVKVDIFRTRKKVRKHLSSLLEVINEVQ